MGTDVMKEHIRKINFRKIQEIASDEFGCVICGEYVHISFICSQGDFEWVSFEAKIRKEFDVDFDIGDCVSVSDILDLL